MSGVEAVPRGIRNNNPGNIREIKSDGTRWVGERATDDDPLFEEFDTMAHGVRALARILRTYQRVHGLKTVRGIIGRWAPACENDTAAYVRHVADRMRADPDAPINLAVPGRLADLVAAVIDHECGYRKDGSPWVSTPTILAGVHMA
jgi:hypothetical protein